jgi:FkbM family methyltransferase
MYIIFRKFKTLIQKLSFFWKTKKSIGHFIKDLYLLSRYACGQVIAFSGIGKYIPFSTHGYRLFLSKSPVAMVQFGNPNLLREEESFAVSYLTKGGVVLDVGANIGNFSLSASKVVGEGGKVVAFEAHPETALYARRNFKLNNAYISLHSYALGNEEKIIHFSSGVYNNVNHVVQNGGVEVPVKRLDDVQEVQELRHIDLLKIDVEGYELPVMEGAVVTLKKTSAVYFEVFESQTKRYAYSAKDLFTFFEHHGFTVVDPVTRVPLQVEKLSHSVITNCLAVTH